MKKYLIALITAIAAFGSTTAQQNGKYIENLTLESKYLKGTRHYSVYLPAGYQLSERTYPVLYLLHGAGDNHTSWEQFGEVSHIADKAMDEGSATPMIIVMPDAHEGYFNELDNSWHGEDFFFKELIPHVEKTYRVKTDKQFRAVAGLSMGGGGSIGYALRHPDMFSAVCPLSAAPGPADYEEFINRSYRRIGKERTDSLAKSVLDSAYIETNLIEKFRSLNGEQLEKVKKLRWYFDCGDDDHLSIRLADMRKVMDTQKIPHEYRVRNGSHNWEYWRGSLPQVLKFVSKSFHR